MDDFLREIPDFDDILFEKRNKEYGAYFLRKRYNRVVIVSLIAAVIIGCTAVLIPYFRIPLNNIEENESDIYSIRYVRIENMRPPVEQVIASPMVQAPSAPPPRAEAAVKYVAPVVVDSIMPFDNTKILTADLMTVTTLDQGVGIGQGIIGGTGTETGILSEFEGGEGNGPFMLVEVMPTFKGGDINNFREWIIKRTVYPQMASDNGIEGIVYVTFIVETDGSVTNVNVTKGVDPLLDNEAIRVVASSPKWEPGRQRGEPVRVRFSIRLNFQN
jgi:protein TonB